MYGSTVMCASLQLGSFWIHGLSVELFLELLLMLLLVSHDVQNGTGRI